MWTIIFFTSWHCSSFVMGNDDWLSHLSWYLRSIWHFGSGWCTPLQIRIALNMNPIEQNHFKRGHQVHFTIYPPPLSSTIIRFYAWTGNWWISISNGYGYMDLNPICHPSPAHKRMKCSFLDYVQLLMIGWAAWWTRTPSTIPLQPEKWDAHFSIMFNFWWWAGLVDGLKPHPPPLSSQKNEMLIFGLHSTSGDRQSNPSNKSQLKCDKRPPKSSKNEIFIFINYIQLLMIGQVIQATKVDQNAKKDP